MYQLNSNNHFLIFFINCQQETHNVLFTMKITFPKMAKIDIYALVKLFLFDKYLTVDFILKKVREKLEVHASND